jgi:hypothetical protein
MANSVFEIPDPITFEQAIALTQALLAQMEQAALSEPEIQQTIADLVRSENGARGFFVAYLSGGSSLADHPSPAVIQALRSSPDIVSELLVKNLSMSTAMAITHRRNQNEEMVAGSNQVRARASQLLQTLELPEVRVKAQAMLESVQTGEGSYQSFLNRWQYDNEQRKEIEQVLRLLLNWNN